MWREGKKKDLEGEEEWPEGGDEVSATQRGRTERAGGVAAGGAQAGGDCTGAWAPSQHGIAGTEAQWYRARRAQQRAHARRYRSRRNSQFGPGQWERVEELLREEWSPEQVSGHLRLERELTISHETIYRHIWRDLRAGGSLHEHLLRCAQDVPKTLRALRQPRAPGGQKDDLGAARQDRASGPDGPLGDRHDDGREPGGEQPLRADPGRTQKPVTS